MIDYESVPWLRMRSNAESLIDQQVNLLDPQNPDLKSFTAPLK